MPFLRSFVATSALSLAACASFAQTAPAVSTVVSFSSSNPVGNLVRGPDGALYGAASAATPVTTGLVFRTTVDGSDIKTLYQLTAEDGLTPQAGLTLGSDGMLYGTTKFGRASELNGTGTVFRVSPSGGNFTVLHRFALATAANSDQAQINTDGAGPEAELTEGPDGALYGVTRAGGPSGFGTVFKMDKDGSDFQTLHAFAPSTETVPDGAVAPLGQLLAIDGMLYGTTSAGGANGRGAIFRIAFDGSRFEVLRTFDAATADATTGLLENTCAAVPENTCGAAPLAGLIDGGDSRYYGVASAGGATGNGVLFAITADGTYTVLHEFDGSNGSRPVGELLLGSDGKLYGSTAGGGQTSGGAASTFGTLFSISRDGTGFTRLYNFDGTKGAAPVGKLIELSNGVFAGTAANNGSCGFGTIYRYSATGDTVTGNTRCGRKKNDNGYGGGAGGPALLLLLGGLACLRQRRH